MLLAYLFTFLAVKMKRRFEEENEFEPEKKLLTCDSLEGYMSIKEKQFLRNGRFLSTPICFQRKIQDHRDPMNIEANPFSLWEVLCFEALNFPTWNYRHDIDSYARITDELCDLIIFEIKAASYSWMTPWEEWQEWDRFLLFCMAQNTQLFRHCQNECIKLIHTVDVFLYGKKCNVEFDMFPEYECGNDTCRYFHEDVYAFEFPNFYWLTTEERQL